MKFAFALMLLLAPAAVHSDVLDFDIFGDSSIYDPSHKIKVDEKTCEYEATIEFNAADANLSFPTIPSEDCFLTKQNCYDFNGSDISCLIEQRHVYEFDKKFTDATGFYHTGIDWTPCGHPPFGVFTKPHLNMHIFRVPPVDRLDATCDMNGPFICDYPGSGSSADLDPDASVQSTLSGNGYFVVGHDLETGLVSNMPKSFRYDFPGGFPGYVNPVTGEASGGTSILDHAVPGEGLHAWDHMEVRNAAEWTKPLLIMGIYAGQIRFWEPMFPIEFCTGDEDKFFEEEVEYVAQTIMSLPSYWSMKYKASTGVTTMTMKGRADSCKMETDTDEDDDKKKKNKQKGKPKRKQQKTKKYVD